MMRNLLRNITIGELYAKALKHIWKSLMQQAIFVGNFFIQRYWFRYGFTKPYAILISQ